MRLLLFLLIFLFFIQVSSAHVMVVELKNTITPASDDIIAEALEKAKRENAQALIITLNTPGGGLEETKRIIQLIEASEIPVIGYVYPRSATAWSAGTLILLSTDIAAMAPNTIIGSVQPVEMTSEGMKPVEEEKILNAVIALAEERARLHGRNVTIAREFITKNLNLNAEQAKQAKVIEVISPSMEELLDTIHGMRVKGKVLNTSGAEIMLISLSPRLMILNLFSNPILASLLLLIGIYSLVFGLTSPGFGAEIFGVISITLGLIGLGFSINIAAIFLIILGTALLLYELYISTFGLLGIGGIVCIVLGSIMLVPVGFPGMYSPQFQKTLVISLLTPAVVFGIFLAFAIYKMLRIRTKRPEIGEMIGDTAETIDTITPETPAYIRYQGEYWRARSDEEIKPNTKVIITGKEGRILIVKPANQGRT